MVIWVTKYNHMLKELKSNVQMVKKNNYRLIFLFFCIKDIK